MPKIVTLNELRVTGMFVDILNQKVVVNYSFHDSTGKKWGDGDQEIYWVTLPQTPTSKDVQLPSQYLQNLTDLYNAAKAALTSKYLI